MDPRSDEAQAAVRRLCEEEEQQVRVTYLHGSHASGKADAESDIDIAVSFAGNIPDDEAYQKKSMLTEDLYDLFGREDIEVVNVESINPVLMMAVARDGRVLYEKYPNQFFKWQIFAGRIFRDTEWVRKMRDYNIEKFISTHGA